MARSIDLTRQSSPPPELEEIREFAQEAETQQKHLRKQWDDLRDLRSQTNSIPIPKRMEDQTFPVHSHWVEDTLRRIDAHLGTNLPTAEVPTEDETKEAQEQSSKIEKWVNGCLEMTDSASAPLRYPRMVMGHAAGYGIGILKSVYDPTAWRGEPTSKRMPGASDDDVRTASELYHKTRLPIKAVAVDPRTWWGFRPDGVLTDTVEMTQRSVQQITRRYRVQLDDVVDPKTLGATYADTDHVPTNQRVVECVEHYNETWRTFVANNKIVYRKRHSMGRPPYFPFYGLVNAMADPGRQMEPILRPYVGLVQLWEQLATMWLAWVHRSAYAMGVLEGPQGAPALEITSAAEGEQQRGPATLDWDPGGILVADPGWKLNFQTAPPVSSDVVKFMQMLESILQSVIPNVLRGIGESGQPAWAIRQLAQAAKMVYTPVIGNASIAYEEMFRFWLDLCEFTIKDRVYVWRTLEGQKRREYVSLGPEDIRGYRAITARMEPVLPDTLIADGQFGLQQVEAGAIDMNTHREQFLHIPDPERIERKVMLERLKYDPQSPLYQWMAAEAIKAAGVIRESKGPPPDAVNGLPLPPGLEEMLAEQAAMAGQMPTSAPGLPGGPGGPGGPMAPEPGLGLPLQQAPLQAPGVQVGQMAPLPNAGVPGEGLASGMPGGRAAGVARPLPALPGGV